jgi:hypothetical protein
MIVRFSKEAMDVIEAAKAYIDAAEKSTAELGAPDMSVEESEAFLRLKDRVFLLEMRDECNGILERNS